MAREPQIDPGAAHAALRLMLFCDRPSASQEVHLLRALRRARRAGQCALAIYSEAAAAAHDAARAFEAFRPHALILSRFAGREASAAIAAARAHGAPIITHLDDYLLDVPPDLGPEKVRQHMRPERIAALTESLASADLLYISTAPLAARVRSAGFTAPIIVPPLQSCADPDELATPVTEEAGIVRIGYHATRNHIHDLNMIAPALLAAFKQRPQARLELFGTIEPPEALKPLGPRLTRIPPAADYDSFLDRLRQCRWQLGLGPLRPIAYNSYRTYTKWTECAIAGIPMLASDNPAYRPVMSDGAGQLVADGDWERALIAAIDDAPARASWIAAAQAKLRSELTLTAQEGQVLAMLKQAGVSS